MWWQSMLWGMLGGGVLRVGWNTTRYAIVSAMDARLERKRANIAAEAVANPEAVAERLGLPIDVVKRYVEGQSVRDQMKGEGYDPTRGVG